MNLLLFDSKIKCLTIIIYYPKTIKFRIYIILYYIIYITHNNIEIWSMLILYNRPTIVQNVLFNNVRNFFNVYNMYESQIQYTSLNIIINVRTRQ